MLIRLTVNRVFAEACTATAPIAQSWVAVPIVQPMVVAFVFVEPAPIAFVAPVPVATFHRNVWPPPTVTEVAVPIVATVSTTMSVEFEAPVIDAFPVAPLVAVQAVGATCIAPVKYTAPATIEAVAPPDSVTLI